jgi:hypothetical protein
MRHYCRMRALIALCLLAAPAAAEINMAESIEWVTADSDVVVRGFVSGYSTTKIDKAEFFDVTVTISETIKGGVKKSVRVGMLKGGGPTPEVYLRSKADVLVFLVEGRERSEDDRGFAQFPFALRRGMDTPSLFPLGDAPAYTTAFAMLKKPTEVLAAVRGAATSNATKSMRVEVPWDTPAMTALYGGSSVYMDVPVDAALEKRAIEWIASADVGTREQGALALAHFRSDANIARMKKLLADADFATMTFDDKRRVKRYLVRAVAHEALKRWNVAHQTPVIEERLAK